MKNLIIISDLTEMPEGLILILFIVIFIFIIFGLKKILDRLLKPNKEVIIEPTKIVQLQELPIGTTFIVLDIKRKLPIVQKIEDYQEGMITDMFANTFYLENFGEDKLERLKTYDVESVGKGEIRVLKQIAVFL